MFCAKFGYNSLHGSGKEDGKFNVKSFRQLTTTTTMTASTIDDQKSLLAMNLRLQSINQSINNQSIVFRRLTLLSRSLISRNQLEHKGLTFQLRLF